MDWKDTVQHHSKTVGCPHCDYEFEINDTVDDLNIEQAEISFKIGKTAGVAESLIPAVKAIDASRKAGIKEVMDWIEEFPSVYKPSPEAMHAKLIEWGITKDIVNHDECGLKERLDVGL